MINIEKLIANKELSDYLNMFLDNNIDFKIASNILLEDITSYLNKTNKSIYDTTLTKDRFIELTNAIKTDKISSKIFKIILDDYLETNTLLDDLLKEKDLIQISDKEEIRKLIKKVLLSNEESVKDYKNGKENAYKYLMGMVMKESKGKVNPKISNELLREELNK